MEDSPQEIHHKEDSPHNKYDREFERKRRTNFATVPMWKIRHTTVKGWGRVGRVGVRRVEVGVVGSGGWAGEFGVGGLRLGSGGWGRGLGLGNLKLGD